MAAGNSPLAVAPKTPVEEDIKQRVVVLGGGFAGVYTAKYLTRMLDSRHDVHVELLSEENYFVFQPLLPEVAAGSITPNHVVKSIRDSRAEGAVPVVQDRQFDTHKVFDVAQGEGRELRGALLIWCSRWARQRLPSMPA